MMQLAFDVPGNAPISFEPSALVVAGWTGRDSAAIEHHIEELARLGVPRPSSVPLFYRVSRQMLTQASHIEALGDSSSGEAEPVLLRHQGQWWLTVGSDHTDRAVEAYSVAVSKQMCPKILATTAWRWQDVAERADALRLRSEVWENGRWVIYQEGLLAAIRPLLTLAAMAGDLGAQESLVMFGGTVPARPNEAGMAIRPAPRMKIELHDPQTGRQIAHHYEVTNLPLVA